jgi:predicted Zn-dependent protease
MKHWIWLAGIVGLCVAAVVVSERRKVDVEASPAALLYLVADTEQELTRMPVNFTRMSDEEEIRVGDEIAETYSQSSETKKDPNVAVVEQYLTQVGGVLAGRAHRKLPYRFHYIPNQYMINAFALPGGHVYVGAGLLALMDSEDELAAVIGHEIEHVDHYHCAERAQQEQALRRIPLGGIVGIPVFVFEAGYSKDQELEADREGTRLAVQAGYSANGAIRLFEAFDHAYENYRAQRRRAASPQQELSDVAMQTLEGYFRSHPLPAERIAQIQKMIASESWQTKAERDLAVAYIFWTDRARTAMAAKKYADAEQLASRSLKMHPDQEGAWDVLGHAQFAQAKFMEAAASYRNLLERSPKKLLDVEAYALALAAANRQRGASEFRAWLDSVRGEKPRNAEAELVGLSMLAGDSARARRYEQELRLSDDQRAPDYLGDLAWWCYMAGDYEHAAQIFDEVVQQRPGDVMLWLHRAWADIQVKRYSDAIQTVNNGAWNSTGMYEEHPEGERAMAQGVAFWQASETDSAMGDFDRAIAGQPEWDNPQWVRALYSPLVADSVQQMKEERERRKKQRMAEKR